MATIDPYIRNLEHFGATGLVLKSDSHIMMRFPTGDRYATQSTAHTLLTNLIKEIAPESSIEPLRLGDKVHFDYQSGGNNYQVGIQFVQNKWTITINRTELSTESTAAEAVDELPITRHNYASSPKPQFDPGPSDEPATAVAPAKTVVEANGLVDKLLMAMIEAGASDLHLCSQCRPMIRASGDIIAVEGFDVLSADALENAIKQITPTENWEEFVRRNDTDYGYAIEGLSRFRANLFCDRKGPGAVFRAIPFEMPTYQQLGLPETILELCRLTKGLVVVTGPTGSGKSTTLAALIDYINQTRCDHLITIEDPIEFVHDNKRCLVNQREIHSHTDSFKDALRAALREDPDIVLVGEMRDLETIAIAVETAETGHLVFGTLHTTTAPGTVDRIIDQFPADQQEQIRTMLSESLQGVISQVLCRKIGGGRVAAFELLLGTSAVSNLIREKKTFQLFSIMQTGRKQGMRTLNDSLIELVKQKLVEPAEAYAKTVNKAEFRNLLTREGVEL